MLYSFSIHIQNSWNPVSLDVKGGELVCMSVFPIHSEIARFRDLILTTLPYQCLILLHSGFHTAPSQLKLISVWSWVISLSPNLMKTFSCFIYLTFLWELTLLVTHPFRTAFLLQRHLPNFPPSLAFSPLPSLLIPLSLSLSFSSLAPGKENNSQNSKN